VSTLTANLLDRVEQDLNMLIRDLTPPHEGAKLDPKDVTNFLTSSVRILEKANKVYDLVRAQ
jgi:hypothetical protein